MTNYKFISALLVGKVAIATISSLRLDLNLNLNVALENTAQMDSNPFAP